MCSLIHHFQPLQKITENSSYFGEGPCLSVAHDTVSNLADLSILWYYSDSQGIFALVVENNSYPSIQYN